MNATELDRDILRHQDAIAELGVRESAALVAAAAAGIWPARIEAPEMPRSVLEWYADEMRALWDVTIDGNALIVR